MEKDLYKRRNVEGYSHLLIENHVINDEETFRNFFRLNRRQFNFVISCIGTKINKLSSRRVKSPISAEQKLYVTLRFMATGETFRSLSYAFRISAGYISIIIRDVLKVLCEKLVPIFLPEPTISDFEKISHDFYNKWNFPNCCGAIDGKHVRIICPNKSGSLYYNYKNYFSLVLLATVDANYKFIAIDVGSFGKEGDSSIFEKSNMGRRIRSETFNFPSEKKLPHSDIVLPHVLIGDEAFRLDKHMMKPFPKNQAITDNSKAVFNYRLCRARRVSENAFALLSQVFRIFYSPVGVLPKTTDLIVTAACCLHNMLRNEYLENNTQSYHCDSEIQMPTDNLKPLIRLGGYANYEGFEIRDQFKNYFNSPQGSVTWQEKQVARTESYN